MGAPSGFRTPDTVINNWQVASFPIRSDSCPVHVVCNRFAISFRRIGSGRFPSITCHLRRISVTRFYARWRICYRAGGGPKTGLMIVLRPPETQRGGNLIETR
jgi:hypothetical protein